MPSSDPAGGIRAAASIALVLAALTPGCASRPSVPPGDAPHASAPRLRELQRDLSRILETPDIERGLTAVAVQSVESGEALFRVNGDRLVVPASTLKLVTVAAAVERLGWQYRFPTTFWGTAPVKDGVLAGDLIVSGSGDPTLSQRYGRVESVLDLWADHLRAAGVRRVEGRLVGDDRAFEKPAWGPGWAWDDMQYAYGAGVGALQLDDATQPLVVVPGIAPGLPASAELSGPPGLALRKDVMTAEPGTPPSIGFERTPGLATLRVSGHVAVDAPPLVLYPSVANPTEHFIRSLHAALIARGIAVAGDAVAIDALDAWPIAIQPPLLVHHSPPLTDIVATTLKRSHNLHAESLLRALGRVDSGDGSGAAGLTAVSRVLDAWGIPAGAISAVDGSGLSRLNQVTTGALVMLLRRMARDEHHRERWLQSLPVGGAEGTLASRFPSGAARGRVWAKTGSLAHVRALAGYVRTRDGEMLAFAIVMNNAGAAGSRVEEVIDRAVQRLAEFAR